MDFLNAFFQLLKRFEFLHFIFWNVVTVLVQILTHCKLFEQQIWLFVIFLFLIWRIVIFLIPNDAFRKRGKRKNCHFYGVVWFITWFFHCTSFSNFDIIFKYCVHFLTRSIFYFKNLTHRRIVYLETSFLKRYKTGQKCRFH